MANPVFLDSFCSATCASASTTFVNTLQPVCGQANIFSTSIETSSLAFLGVNGYISPVTNKTVPSNLEASTFVSYLDFLDRIVCVKESKSGAYCVQGQYQAIKSQGATWNLVNISQTFLTSNDQCSTCAQIQLANAIADVTFVDYAALKPALDYTSALINKTCARPPIKTVLPRPFRKTTTGHAHGTTQAHPHSTTKAHATATSKPKNKVRRAVFGTKTGGATTTTGHSHATSTGHVHATTTGHVHATSGFVKPTSSKRIVASTPEVRPSKIRRALIATHAPAPTANSTLDFGGLLNPALNHTCKSLAGAEVLALALACADPASIVHAFKGDFDSTDAIAKGAFLNAFCSKACKTAAASFATLLGKACGNVEIFSPKVESTVVSFLGLTNYTSPVTNKKVPSNLNATSIASYLGFIDSIACVKSAGQYCVQSEYKELKKSGASWNIFNITNTILENPKKQCQFRSCLSLQLANATADTTFVDYAALAPILTSAKNTLNSNCPIEPIPPRGYAPRGQ